MGPICTKLVTLIAIIIPCIWTTLYLLHCTMDIMPLPYLISLFSSKHQQQKVYAIVLNLAAVWLLFSTFVYFFCKQTFHALLLSEHIKAVGRYLTGKPLLSVNGSKIFRNLSTIVVSINNIKSHYVFIDVKSK